MIAGRGQIERRVSVPKAVQGYWGRRPIIEAKNIINTRAAQVEPMLERNAAIIGTSV